MASYTMNPTFSFMNYPNATKSINPKRFQDTNFFKSKISKYHPLQRALFPKNTTTMTASSTTYCCAFNPRPLYIPNKIIDDSYVRVLDTTLRDGEQAPGATMTRKQKLAIARKLAKLGVDIIEAGFPVSSPSEFETTRMIAMEVGNAVDDETGHVPVITGLSRLTRKDIDVTWEALKGAKYPRLMTFIPSSEIHMKYKIKKSKEEVLRSVKEMVSYARGLGIMDIEFATEDSSRSEKEFLYQVFEEAIKAGATTIAFSDTVGCTLPNEWGQFIADMKANIVGVENVIIATHCHDDLGVATANTLAAVNAGAREVHVSINGIGERAGNAPLEEIAMALKSRGKDLLGGLHTGINTRHILMASKMVEEHSGLSVQPNKAIVGSNAFSHGSGIHQDGVLKNRSTYEFLSPEEIGWSPSTHNGIVLGKLSGRHALKSRFLELGYELDGQKFDDAFRRFKLVAEKKKSLSDNDLVLLVSDEHDDETFQPQVTWKLVDMEVTSSSHSVSRATIKLIDACGKEHIACGVGTSSILATCKAIDDIVKVRVKMVEYDMKLGEEGLEGVASIRLVLSKQDNSISAPQIVSGSGGGLDMIMTTARAYMNALNKLLALTKQAI